MGVLSGLKQLGLGGLENIDIYKTDKEEAKRKSMGNNAAASKPKPEEKDFVYEKSYVCPVCGSSFTSKIMKSSKARLVSTDQDLRPRYDVIDALKYDVVLCTICGYGALGSSFSHISPGQKKLVKENICSKVQVNNHYKETYTYEEAWERYQLALANAVIKRSKASEKAFICLKTGWLLRGYAESLKESDGSRELVEELEAQENEYLENAYKGFLEARQSESFPMCRMDELTIDYLLAALAVRFHQYDVAAKLISIILTSSSASARVKDKARNIKEQILGELRKRK